MQLDLEHQTQVLVGLYEREIQRWVKRLSAGIDFGADIGAADGLYTLYLHERTAARAIHAFEPDAGAFAALERNLSLNGLLRSNRLSAHKLFVTDAPAGGRVSLDSMLPNSLGRGFIKVDVDGGEVEVLQGALKLLNNPDVRWLIEIHSQDLETACLTLCRNSGLHTLVIPNAWWRVVLPETRPITHNRWLVAYHPGAI
jgi:hypothetical protein